MSQPATHDADEPLFPSEKGPREVTREFWSISRLKTESLEERVKLLEVEAEVREFIARYYDAVDTGDLDHLMTLYHPECRHTGIRGSVRGRDKIRADLAAGFAIIKERVHLATNLAIRLLDTGEVWLTCRNHGVAVIKAGGQIEASVPMSGDAGLVKESERISAGVTLMSMRLRNEGDGWLIVETRATYKLEWDASDDYRLFLP